MNHIDYMNPLPLTGGNRAVSSSDDIGTEESITNEPTRAARPVGRQRVDQARTYCRAKRLHEDQALSLRSAKHLMDSKSTAINRSSTVDGGRLTTDMEEGMGITCEL